MRYFKIFGVVVRGEEGILYTGQTEVRGLCLSHSRVYRPVTATLSLTALLLLLRLRDNANATAMGSVVYKTVQASTSPKQKTRDTPRK
jgi:hypothetical protein